MRILIVTPAPKGSQQGNRITAERWADHLRQLRHKVVIDEALPSGRFDLLIGMHARKSAAAVAAFARLYPDVPRIVALTGTDLYRDIRRSRSAQRSLELADRLVVLQSAGLAQLEKRHRDKARVIYQSAEPLSRQMSPLRDVFEVAVVGHLRPVKDPLRTARAVRKLPASSRVQVIHIGAALSESLRRQAERELQRNPRYQWAGELTHEETRRRLARSRLLVVSSKIEGGANVICEAIAVGTPVLSTRISGSVGLLGSDYPGYFPVGDTAQLTRLLNRAECNPDFYGRLQSHCRQLRPLVRPQRERRDWRNLLVELSSN